MDTNSPNLLQDFEQEMNLVPASVGTRFANYIIDVIVFYALIFGVAFMWAAATYAPIGEYDTEPSTTFMDYFIVIVVVVGYYTLFEGLTKGKTLGKMITGTVAVKEDGSPLTFKDAFLRSLSRLVPFEPFSAFSGRPWHDSWTNTLVVKKSS